VPIFMALFVVVGAVSVRQQRLLAEDEFRKRGADIAKSLAYSCELGVLAEDSQLLESSIRSVTGDSEVGFIQVYGSDGTFLAEGGRGEEASPLTAADWALLDREQNPFPRGRRVGREYIEFFAPIVSEEVSADELLLGAAGMSSGKAAKQQTVGLVRMGLSLAPVRHQTGVILRLWAGLAGIFFLLSLASVYFFSRRITRPINLLTAHAEKIAEGDLEQTIPVESEDEVGRLAATFNEMAHSLRGNINEKERVLDELQDLNQTLEDRIDKRTEELEELYRLSAAMQEPVSLREALSRVLEGARQLVGIDRVCILVLGTKGDSLVPLSAAGVADDEYALLEGIEIPMVEAGAMADVVRNGVALLYGLDDALPIEVRLEESGAKHGVPESLFLLLPVLARGSAVGVLACDNRSSKRPIRPETLEMLQTFAAHAASAIENAQLFQELESKGREIETANRHKSEFLANMSHELRTPLNAVIGFSEVLLERMFGELNQKQDEYLNDILASGRHLLSLINDILDLSKVEAGQMDLDLSSFDLPSALHNSVTLIKERAQRRSVKVEVDIDPSLEAFVADERKFKQVLLNLLSNAVKFTEGGGTISLRALPVDGMVQFSVVDTGIGISPDDQIRIFEAFRQAETEYVRKTEGTGLGLTLSRCIVELHGGQIWVESELGLGSTFHITLPIRDAVSTVHGPASETANANAESAAAAGQRTASPERADRRDLVLVVEDDPASANLISIHLKGAGLGVELAKDGEEGLALARSLRPQAIVLDILMPRVDGWELLAKLKQDPETAAIHVVIVSMLDERGKGLALGATEHLLKPIDPAELVATIRRACGRSPTDGEVTVLAIDDDSRALELTRATLEPQGFCVLKSEDGEQGIEIARERRPDLIVLDLMMPGMDGFEVAQVLKEDPRTARIPIVILTSKSLSSIEKRRLSGRIAHLARKSEFNRDEFVALLQYAVKQGRDDGQ
jgi:signal transduction histidine kinase/CheY-like chemotaxis protein